jgi:4-hydroxy 2-oxovalerate aldolase
MKKLYIQDVTLRDGMHALRHQFSVEKVKEIAIVLDEAGVDAIEIAHGDGLSGGSFNFGFGAHTDWEWLAGIKDVLKHAKLTTLILPGIGTIHDLKKARDLGVESVRIATHCTEADTAVQHIEAAKKLGMDVGGFLMMAHLNEPQKLAEQAKIMESAGADCVYVTDSAGALLMEGVVDRIKAYKDVLKPETEVGIHCHHNLSLGVANTIVAMQHGATRLDASLTGLGAGAGNAPLEVLIAVLNKMDVKHNSDLYKLMDAADDLIRPLQIRPVRVDRETLSIGYAGVYSSFLIHAEKAAQKYGLDTRTILMELGNRKMVGGQEDMIVDVALDMLSKNGQK